MVDPRSVHVKLITVGGRHHLVTVLPPGPESHDDTVWRQPKAGTHLTVQRRISLTDGTASDIITTE